MGKRSDAKVLIPISPELRQRLKVMIAERGLRSYDVLLNKLLKDLENKEK